MALTGLLGVARRDAYLRMEGRPATRWCVFTTHVGDYASRSAIVAEQDGAAQGGGKLPLAPPHGNQRSHSVTRSATLAPHTAGCVAHGGGDCDGHTRVRHAGGGREGGGCPTGGGSSARRPRDVSSADGLRDAHEALLLMYETEASAAPKHYVRLVPGTYSARLQQHGVEPEPEATEAEAHPSHAPKLQQKESDGEGEPSFAVGALTFEVDVDERLPGMSIGSSSRKPAPRSVRRALLTPRVSPWSRCRCARAL